MKNNSLLKLLKKIHEDEDGYGQSGDDPDHRRHRLADLDLPVRSGLADDQGLLQPGPEDLTNDAHNAVVAGSDRLTLHAVHGHAPGIDAGRRGDRRAPQQDLQLEHV